MDYTANPVFMFSPDWSNGILERLEWLTDVMQSKSGAEQRISKRITPRRGYEITLRIGKQDRQYFDNAMMAYQGSQWLMPIWQDVTRLTQPAVVGDTLIHLDTTYREFVAGGFAIIRGKNSLIYEVVKINAVAPDSLILMTNNIRAWPQGSYIYPAALGVIDGDMSLAKQTDTWRDINVKLAITDTQDYAAAFPAIMYNGLPVLNVRPDESDDLSDSYSRMMDILDGQFGKRTFFDTAGKTFISQAYNWAVIGRAKNAELRSLLYALRGRTKPMWLPTFNQDFTLVAPVGAGDQVMTVANTGFSTINVLQTNRQDVRIELKDGTVMFKRILAYAAISDDQEAIGFDSEFDRDIEPDEVRMISFMGIFRLDSDSIEINHDTDASGLARVATSWKSNPAVRAADDWTPPPFPDSAMNNVLRVCSCSCSTFPTVSQLDDRIAVMPSFAQSYDGLRDFARSSQFGPNAVGGGDAVANSVMNWTSFDAEGNPVNYLAVLLIISLGGLVLPYWFSPEAWMTELGSFPVNYEDPATDIQVTQYNLDTEFFWYGLQSTPVYETLLISHFIPSAPDPDGNVELAPGADYYLPRRQDIQIPDSIAGVFSESCLQIIEGLQEQFSPVALHHVSSYRGGASIFGPLIQYMFLWAIGHGGPSIDALFPGQPSFDLNLSGRKVTPGAMYLNMIARWGGMFDADVIRPKTGAYLLTIAEFHESLQTGDVFSPFYNVIPPGPGPQPNFRELWVRGLIACWVDDIAWPAQVTVNVATVGGGFSGGSKVFDTFNYQMPDGRYFIFGMYVKSNIQLNAFYSGDNEFNTYEIFKNPGETVVVQVTGA